MVDGCHFCMTRPFFLFSILLFPFLAFSQKGLLKGVVLDNFNTPIPFCSIGIKGSNEGVLGNGDGTFALSCKIGDTLQFSFLGFESGLWVANKFNTTVEIRLHRKTYALKEVSVATYRAEKLLRAALNRKNLNYPNSEYTYKAFYRQSHKENKRWVRLIEADIEVLDQGYGSQELFRLNQLRRSRVYEQNRDVHGDHLAELFLENKVHYSGNSFASVFNLGRYDFSFDTTFHNDTISRILFFHSSPAESKVEKGVLDINNQDTAIIRIETFSYPNMDFLNSGVNPSNWHFKEGKVVIHYRKVGNKYYLSFINFSYQHDIYNPIFKTYDYNVEEHFDLYVTYIGSALGVNRKLFHHQSNAYLRQYEYEPLFWKAYAPVTIYPLKSEIAKDLETETSLEEQFSE
jgi:hypothetical protein